MIPPNKRVSLAGLLSGCALLLCLGTGCSGTIDPDLTPHKYPLQQDKLSISQYDLTVKLVLPEEIQKREFNDMEIGEGLGHLLQESLGMVFKEVHVEKEGDDSVTAKHDLEIVPKFSGQTKYFLLQLTGKEPLTHEERFQVQAKGRAAVTARAMNPALDFTAALFTIGLSTPLSVDDYKEAQSITMESLEKSLARTALNLVHQISKHPNLSQYARVDHAPPSYSASYHQGPTGRGFQNNVMARTQTLQHPIPKGKPAGRHDIALLVGNRNYQKEGIPKVEFALKDLDLVKRYLIQTMGFHPENIITYADATKGDFETLFGSHQNPRGKLSRWTKRNLSRVFIYYTGHGAPELNGDDLYFVPVDADLDYISQSGYSVSLFYKNLGKIDASEVIIVLDTCFSGRTPQGFLFKDTSNIIPVPKDVTMPVLNAAVLTSAHNDQVSTWFVKKGHSLFTYFFLLGLQGEADLNRNKVITTGEMKHFLVQKVPYMARRIANKEQIPKLEGRDDLILAILKE